MPPTGWVPQRSSVAHRQSEVDPAVVSPVVDPAVVSPVVDPAVVPEAGISAEEFWASEGWAPSGVAQVLPDNGGHRRPGLPMPAILTVPVSLRGVRAKPRRLAVLGILLLLVAVAGVFGIRVAWAGASARPESIPAAHGPPGGLVSRSVPPAFATAGAAGSPTATASAGATSTVALMIHVVGQVRHPGVVRLPPGSRVLDAVDAAGGVSPSADLFHLNLARVLVDGEQIVVPKPGEVVPAARAAQGTGAGSSGQGSTGATPGALVNLNTADATALDSLPGVGPVLAQRILDWRTAHGRFSTVNELGEVSGIGDKFLAQISPKVTV